MRKTTHATPFVTNYGGASAPATARYEATTVRPQTRRQIAKECAPVVYAFRLAGGVIKIGHTTDIAQRAHNLGCGLDALLALRPGTRADEAAIHATLIEHRHHGHEYYYPTPAVMAVVNDMRATFGLSPVAA